MKQSTITLFVDQEMNICEYILIYFLIYVLTRLSDLPLQRQSSSFLQSSQCCN